MAPPLEARTRSLPPKIRIMMQRLTFGAALLAGSASVAHAQTTFTPVTYELQPNSSMQEGCLGPCLCAMFWYGDMTGTFEMAQTIPAPLNFETYTITDIDWHVSNFIGNSFHVSGSGTYTIGGLAVNEQRLTLDLVIDGQALDQHDSGWVIVDPAVPFPAISALTGQNDFICYDQMFQVDAEPAIYDAYCSSVANSTGLAATMQISGSNSLFDNSLTLTARHTVPGQPGMFFFGPDEVAVPFGNGTRCVGGSPTNRFSTVLFADETGAFSLQTDHTILPDGVMWMTGSTWRFQAVYRDPGVGTGYNMTDAGTVVFTN